VEVIRLQKNVQFTSEKWQLVEPAAAVKPGKETEKIIIDIILLYRLAEVN